MGPQYECVPRQKKCKKLLKNAVLQHEGGFYENPFHRYNKYEAIFSSSLFFSNMPVLKHSVSYCDVTGNNHEDICSAAEQSDDRFLYKGKCKPECSGYYPVCGYDDVTYSSACVAASSGQLVQYEGECLKSANCSLVKCTQPVTSGCDVITPQGSCCPVCAGMFRVIFSRKIMRTFSPTVWKGPVTVNDVIVQLERLINIYECKVYGFLTEDDDIAVLITPLSHGEITPLLVKACASEAERVTSLINKRHPRMTSDLVLSSLLASRLHAIPTSGESASGHLGGNMPVLITTLLTSLFSSLYVT